MYENWGGEGCSVWHGLLLIGRGRGRLPCRGIRWGGVGRDRVEAGGWGGVGWGGMPCLSSSAPGTELSSMPTCVCDLIQTRVDCIVPKYCDISLCVHKSWLIVYLGSWSRVRASAVDQHHTSTTLLAKEMRLRSNPVAGQSHDATRRGSRWQKS